MRWEKQAASLADVMAVQTPPATDTYTPAPYGRFLDALRAAARVALDAEPASSTYALTANGNRLFVLDTFDVEDQGGGVARIAVGARTSHDRSIAAGIATGTSVMVCSNLCFSGDSYVAMRRHTVNFWEDFEALALQAVRVARDKHLSMLDVFERLSEVPVEQDEGYGLIGRAGGAELLSPRQLGVALRSWREPPQADWRPRNGMSLYQALTEAAKHGPPEDVMLHHGKLHEFVVKHLLGEDVK